MNQPMINRVAIATLTLLATGAIVDGVFSRGVIMPPAAAIVGRPATPVSVAGAARRTTRRVIRRSTIYAATLPANCYTVVIEGASLYQCGTTYYQPYNNQYVVVYID
ncbi:hypothetical protein [Halomicronema sp. CCY15110]|uniref:hypothetical protein n=1 Tax=Halomicronema sp. CCY15110 TaxID=2767773 RepID=UPI00195102E9|nr:hypothetical protein [Halomicronema sp. CCY15110]